MTKAGPIYHRARFDLNFDLYPVSDKVASWVVIDNS
jgi:hypothetical protein